MLDAVPAIPAFCPFVENRGLAGRVDALDALEHPLAFQLGKGFAHRPSDDGSVTGRSAERFVHGLVPELGTAGDADLRLGLTEELRDPAAVDARRAGQLKAGRRLGERGPIGHAEFLQQR